MGRTPISYDSSWEEIRETARSAPWASEPVTRPSPLGRTPFTDDELVNLSGIPVLVIHERNLPPHPASQPTIPPAESRNMLSRRTQALFGHIRNFGFRPDDAKELAQDLAGHTEYFVRLFRTEIGSAGAPPVRKVQTDQRHAHRLDGSHIPQAAIFFTDCAKQIRPSVISCAERQIWMPKADFNVVATGHELTHLLQLRHADSSLQEQTEVERDAENNSLLLYQSVFGGTPTLAAAKIVSHLSMQFQVTPRYCFYPGQHSNDRSMGKAQVTALRLAALYHHTGQPVPQWPSLMAMGQIRANTLTLEAARQDRPDVDDIYNFAMGYVERRGVPGMLQDALLGLKSMKQRHFEPIPPEQHHLAGLLADAATFTNPALMEHDPVKPRVSWHFTPKRNSAALA